MAQFTDAFKYITQPKWVNVNCWFLFECGINLSLELTQWSLLKQKTFLVHKCSIQVIQHVKDGWLTYSIMCPGNIFDQQDELSLVAWIKQFLYALDKYQFPKGKLMMMGNFVCMYWIAISSFFMGATIITSYMLLEFVWTGIEIKNYTDENIGIEIKDKEKIWDWSLKYWNFSKNMQLISTMFSLEVSILAFSNKAI